MKAKRMNVSLKIILIGVLPILILGITLQTINYMMSRNSFGSMSSQFEETLNNLSADSINELTRMSEQSARDLIQQIRLTVGNSLQPGEAIKFLGLAKEQAELEQVEEFSFYGPDGALELSSNEHTLRQTVPNDVMAEVQRTGQLVIRGTEESARTMHFYQPLFMDADMIRMNPECRVGQFFGMLFVELNKDHIFNSIQSQRQNIEQAVQATQETTRRTMARNLTISCSVVGIFIAVLSALIIPLSNRTVIRPMQIAIETNRKIAKYISSAAVQFRSASEVIAQGATEQAAGLEETSSSLEEMASMTKQNAANAQQANALAAEARKAADTGAESMTRMSAAINDIQKSSDETAKIIKVIDEIAFQTNLLALNAAVEAARAGEAGKGFAVVAEEVRNLAMRSAEAAKNTASMIEESVKNSKNGVDIASEVGKVLDEIVQGIGKTTDLVGEIAAASQEQAQGIDQVNTAVAQMDKVTQQNAANAEESASASEELSSQAESMNEIVGELTSLVGGSRLNFKSKAHKAPARHTHPAARSQNSAAPHSKHTQSNQLGKSDETFHQIARHEGQAVGAKHNSADRRIPLDDNEGFDSFNA